MSDKSLLKKLALVLAATSVWLGSTKVVKAETLKVDREFALAREIEVDVTQMGIVIDFKTQIHYGRNQK